MKDEWSRPGKVKGLLLTSEQHMLRRLHRMCGKNLKPLVSQRRAVGSELRDQVVNQAC